MSKFPLVYVLSPCLGLACSEPEIRLIDGEGDQMRLAVEWKAVAVERDDPGSEWRLSSAPPERAPAD